MLTIVTGPDGPSLTIVLREAFDEVADVGFDDVTLSCTVPELDDGLPPT